MQRRKHKACDTSKGIDNESTRDNVVEPSTEMVHYNTDPMIERRYESEPDIDRGKKSETEKVFLREKDSDSDDAEFKR